MVLSNVALKALPVSAPSSEVAARAPERVLPQQHVKLLVLHLGVFSSKALTSKRDFDGGVTLT